MKTLLILLFLPLMGLGQEYLVYNNFKEANDKQEYITHICKLNGVFDANTKRLCYVQKNSTEQLFNIIYDVDRTKGFGYDFTDFQDKISRDALMELDSIWIDIK